jgi:hypothetical protein
VCEFLSVDWVDHDSGMLYEVEMRWVGLRH